MVARASLLEPLEVGLQVVLREERRAVDAGEHRAVRVAAPVGAGGGHQLERLDAAGAGAVRPAAEVGEGAVAVERDGLDALVAHEVPDQLDLVVLALALEALDRVLHRHVAALERLVGLDVLAHLRLDALEVGVRDLHPVGEVEVVVEAVVDRRADRDLGAGVELEHGLGEHVGGVVAEQVEGLGALVGDDRDRLALVEGSAQIAQVAVDLDRQRRACQALADCACGVGAGGAVLQLELVAVWERDLHAAWKLAGPRARDRVQVVFEQARDQVALAHQVVPGGRRARLRGPDRAPAPRGARPSPRVCRRRSPGCPPRAPRAGSRAARGASALSSATRASRLSAPSSSAPRPVSASRPSSRSPA